MRAIRLTKSEADVIERAIGLAGSPWGETSPDHKAMRSVLAKLKAAREPANGGGADVGPIQTAMVAAARGKVVPLVTGYPVASRRCAQLGVTPDDARAVGEWMARQGWLRGPQTLLDVLNKWPQWLSKARATAAPEGLKPGLDGGRADTGQGDNGKGSGAAPGRPARGFG